MISATVLITCYNLERYIGDAIRSVLAQTFDGGVEVIAVDDCSTDGSADIIRSFPEVRYLKTERNGGVLLATLTGIEAATTDILFFLDGDDLWEPAKLATVLPRFAVNPRLGLVTHDLSYVDGSGRPLARTTLPAAKMADVPLAEVSAKVRNGILEADDFVWLGSAYAVRKSIADLNGFVAFARALPDPANTYQDWPLAFWVAARHDVALDYVPDKLFRYRLHQLNYSGDAGTPDKAIRNFRRAINTNRAQIDIARARGLPGRVLEILEARVRFYEYLVDLFIGRRAKALRGFIASIPDLRRRGLLGKELFRFLAVQTFGPEGFSRLATRRTVLRNLPTS